jgi:hypothetical protein
MCVIIKKAAPLNLLILLRHQPFADICDYGQSVIYPLNLFLWLHYQIASRHQQPLRVFVCFCSYSLIQIVGHFAKSNVLCHIYRHPMLH